MKVAIYRQTKKSASDNERFAKIAALSRRKESGILKVCNPLKMNRLPQLRQAATTLSASERERGGESREVASEPRTKSGSCMQGVGDAAARRLLSNLKIK